MRTLLSLVAAAAFSAPVFAQSDVILGQQAGIAYMVSKDQAVESRVAYAGYLFNKAELDSTEYVEYSNGYEIQEGGLYYDYSVHARSDTKPWEQCGSELDYVVNVFEKRGKPKAQAELKQRVEALARVIKREAKERNMDALSSKLDEVSSRVPSATEALAQLALARDLDRIDAALP